MINELIQRIALSLEPLSKAEIKRQIKDVTLDGLTKSQRYTINYLGNKLQVDPRIVFLILNESLKVNLDDITIKEAKQVTEVENGAQESWAEGLTASQRRRVRLQANKLGITPIEVLMRRVKPQDKETRKEVTRALSKQLKEINSNELNNVKFPDHIQVKSWNDILETEDVVLKANLTVAKGICMQLVNGEVEEKRYQTFIEDGKQMHLDVIKNKTMDVIISSCNNEEMINIEKNFSKKVGSFKSLPYYQWVDKVIGLWKEVSFNPDAKLLNDSVNHWYNELETLLTITTGDNVLKPLSLDMAYEKVTKGRNSGYPFFTSKWADDDNKVAWYKNQANEMLNGNFSDAPRILFKRVQYNGNTSKMRPVECPPKSEAIAAKTFTDVLVNAFKSHPQFVGFNGGGQIGAHLQPLLNYEYMLSSDFSAFDTTCKNFIPIVFKMMNQLSGYKFTEYFNSIEKYYLNSELLTPHGLLSSNVTNGLNSGDGWTSIIGTLTNAIANTYVLKRMNLDAKVLSFGDDCVVVSNSPIDTDDYSTYMGELGLECNPQKQELTSGDSAYFSFLGYYYFKQDKEKPFNELGKFPIMRILSGLVYYERFNKLEDLIIEADLSEEDKEKILNAKRVGVELLGHVMKLDNCKNHESFDSFVEFFKSHEKYNMKTELIFPMEKLMSCMKQLRFQRGKTLANSSTMKKLLKLEYGDNVQSILEASITIGVAEEKLKEKSRKSEETINEINTLTVRLQNDLINVVKLLSNKDLRINQHVPVVDYNDFKVSLLNLLFELCNETFKVKTSLT